MTRPSLHTYAFGNILTLLAMCFLLALSGYSWIIGNAEWGWPMAMLVATGYCWQCAQQIQAYRDWKREWDALEGQKRRPPLHERAPALRWLSSAVVLGALIWLMAVAYEGDDRGPMLIGMSIAEVLLIGGFALALRRPLRGRAASKVKPVQVAVCLPVAPQSPQPVAITSSLPEYCTRLLQR